MIFEHFQVERAREMSVSFHHLYVCVQLTELRTHLFETLSVSYLSGFVGLVMLSLGGKDL